MVITYYYYDSLFGYYVIFFIIWITDNMFGCKTSFCIPASPFKIWLDFLHYTHVGEVAASARQRSNAGLERVYLALLQWPTASLMIRAQYSVGEGIFFATTYRLPLGPKQSLVQWALGLFSGDESRFEADVRTAFNIEVKNVWNHN
jgi:hypothetical protein